MAHDQKSYTSGEARDMRRVADQYGVAAVFDSSVDGNVRIEKQRKRVWDVADEWGNGTGNDTFAPDEYVRFHPGRDLYGKKFLSDLAAQALRLEDAGVMTFDSLHAGGYVAHDKFLKGAEGYQDFNNLLELCRGRDAGRVFDIAPDLFTSQELIYQTGEIIEQKFVKLTARDYLPYVNHNTWFKQYRFDRLEDRGSGFSIPVNINDMSGIPTPKQSEQRDLVFRPLYHHYSGAVWSDYEIEEFAEARANGAPDIQIVKRRTNQAQMDLKRTDNCLAYFGHPNIKDMDGIVYTDEIDDIPAAQQLGQNSNPEEDRLLLVNIVSQIFEESIDNEMCDTILMGTRSWAYLNKTIYKNLSSGSVETLLEVILRAVGPMGVKRIEWAPEMDYRAAQALRLQNEHGFSQALAERWSGGKATQNLILFTNSARSAGYVGMGKETAVQPSESFRSTNEQRYLMSSGSYNVLQPAAHRRLTNVGPFVP